jgi:hypothetical protein
VENGKDYMVEYRKIGGGDWIEHFDYTGTAEMVAVIDVLNLGQYEFKVTAIGWETTETLYKEAVSPVYSPVNVTEQLSSPVLGDVTAPGSSTINVAWSAVENANGYVVEYATNDSFKDALTVSVTGTSTTLTDLMANKTYYVRVMATGTGDYSNSDWSGVKSATTEDSPSVTMGNFRDTDKTENSVTLVWNAVPGATSYEIRYRLWDSDGKGSDQWKYVTATGTTTVISGLESGMTYEFQMRSRGSGSANSGWSDGVFVTTYAKANVVTASSSIDKTFNTVKGAKLDKKEDKPTQNTFAFTWYPTSFNAEEITFDVMAPKPKGKGKVAPCVATATITKDQLDAILDGTLPRLPIVSGDCKFTITKKTDSKGNVGIKVKVAGLNAGTKYTINMQAANITINKFSKVTKVSASTAKYAAPKSAGKAIVSSSDVTFAWKQSAATPADMVPGTNREYTVGLWVDNEFIAFGSGEGAHTRIINESTITITVTGTKAVVTGLASAKYTFGIQESVSVGEDIAKSAITKISVKVKW